ncbi:MAG: hypothetical protein ACE5D2_00830 [Fidelibacterota bacterium]
MIGYKQILIVLLVVDLSGQGEFPGLDSWHHTQTLMTSGAGDMLISGISEFDNPALLPYLNNRFRLSWIQYPAGIRAESIMLNLFHSQQFIGVRVKHLGYGIFQGRDENNEPTGEYSSGDLQFLLSWARKVLGDRGALGVTTGVFFSSLEKSQAIAMVFTPGLVVNFQKIPGRLGIRVSNLGTVISSYTSRKNHLPGAVVISYGRQLAHLPLEFGIDLRQTFRNKDLTLSIGGIFNINNVIQFKWGISSDKGQKFNTVENLFSRTGFGLGFNNGEMAFDVGVFSYQSGGLAISLGMAVNY